MSRAKRYETTLLLVMAGVLTATAILVLSGFPEPSKPPSVDVVEIGIPLDQGDRGRRASPPLPARQAPARAPTRPRTRPAPSGRQFRRTRTTRPSPSRATPSAPSAPAAPADDGADEADDD